MKKVYIALIAFCLMFYATGCNRQVVDLTYKYERAIIKLPDGTVVDGRVSSWKDYDDGDQMQVVIDGVTYLVHSNNVALLHDKND